MGRLYTRGVKTAKDPDLTRQTFAVEEQGGTTHWGRRVLQTFWATLVAPRRMFAACEEPVVHGRVLRYLGTLRFVPLVGVLVALFSRLFGDGATAELGLRPIHSVLPAAFVEALSTWLLMMVPVGLPLHYFTLGLLAHVGIALTGGASRSLGASMRAVGYAFAPAFLIVAILDVPLYLGSLDGDVYVFALGVACVSALSLASIALAQTHRISVVRTCLISVLPVVVFALLGVLRAVLELKTISGLNAPTDLLTLR